jgi:hypothetical protein
VKEEARDRTVWRTGSGRGSVSVVRQAGRQAGCYRTTEYHKTKTSIYSDVTELAMLATVVSYVSYRRRKTRKKKRQF